MLIMLVSPTTMATSEQLENLVGINILNVIRFHVLLSLLETTMSVSEDTMATVERISMLEGAFQKTYGIFG